MKRLGAPAAVLLGCCMLLACRREAAETGGVEAAAKLSEDGAERAAGADAVAGEDRTPGEKAAREEVGIDTTGLGVPGADSIRPRTPMADSLVALAGDSPSRGPENAAVVIIEFSDFECPFCSAARESLDRLMQDRPDLRLVYMQYPILSLHPRAMLPAEASLEAHRQGKFWEYHDALFEHGGPFDHRALLEVGRKVGLDVAVLKRALDRGTHRTRVERDMRIGNQLGVTATPTFFVNGYKFMGARPYETFVALYNVLLRASRRSELAETGSPS